MILKLMAQDFALATGLWKPSGSAFLDVSLRKFREEIDSANMKGGDWRDRLSEKLGFPNSGLATLHVFDMIIEERKPCEVSGVFTFGNAVTHVGDEFRFTIHVEMDESGNERCLIHMPHHPQIKHPEIEERNISTNWGRFEMIAFLKGEAKDRAGFEASLRRHGFPPVDPDALDFD